MYDERFQLGRLKETDARLLDATEWRDLEIQTDLFFGRGRKHVQRRLQTLGMGIKGDQHPIESALLQSILQTRAVVYASPPQRSLRGFAETSPEHRRMVEVLNRASYDAFLREADIRRVLWRTLVVRFYWSQRRGALVPRMFGPGAVLRSPGSEPDVLADDREFALQRSSGQWEYWHRDEAGVWSMALTNAEGGMLPMSEQPFAETELVSPYPTLPAHVVFDGFSDAPYLPVPSHRTAFALGIATASNEIQEAIRASSRVEVQYEQLQSEMAPVGPGEMPSEMGPGIRPVLPPGVQGRTHDLTPQLADSLAAIESLESQWLRAEGIDPGYFRRSQNVTAAALRQLQAPLRELQERLRPWAVQAEREAWQAIRGVHNYHRPDEPLAEAELDVQLAPLSVPEDPESLHRNFAQARALGVASVIDHVAATWNVSREDATSIHLRVAQDRDRFPVLVDADALAAAAEGPRTPNPEPAGLNPNASMIDNVREIASGD